MGTQVPPSKVPTPEQERPAPPKKEDELPDDYRKTFRVSLKYWCCIFALSRKWRKVGLQVVSESAYQGRSSSPKTLPSLRRKVSSNSMGVVDRQA